MESVLKRIGVFTLLCMSLLCVASYAQGNEEMLQMPEVTTQDDSTQHVDNQEKQNPGDDLGNTSELESESGDEQAQTEQLPPIEKMPVLDSFIEAEYPESVYTRGIEGTVLMTLLVSDSGTVDSVWVDEGLHPVLDSNAVTAARKFEFQPAIAGGDSVAVYLQYEYRYSLQEIAGEIEPIANFGGRFLERGTRAPVPDAMVVITFLDTVARNTAGLPLDVYINRIGEFEGQYLEEDRLVTMSDSNGQFTFYSIPGCKIAISVPAAGYEMFSDTLKIPADQEVRMEFYLHRLSYSDYEIVVYGKTKKKEVSRRQLTLNEIKKIPGLGGDAVKVVQALPGVNRPRMGFGQVVVRGAPSWDSNFYLDGVTLPALYHFGGLKSVYNSTGLEGVSFYPGGFGTRYGGGIAGAVELNSRKPKTDRWHGAADISTLDAALEFEGPVNDKLSVMGSGRRSFVGDLVSWFLENSDVDFPFSVTPFYWDYYLKTNYKYSENLNLFSNFVGSRDSMSMHYPQMQGGSSEVDEAKDRASMALMFHLQMVGADWKINDRFSNSFRFSHNYTQGGSSIFGFVKTYSSSHDFHIRDQLDVSLRDNLKLSAGTDLYFMNLDLNLAIPQKGNIIRRDTVENWWFGTLGGYSFLEYNPMENLQLIGGLRYDFYKELDYHGSYIPEFWDYNYDNTTRFAGEPSARINARYSINDNHVVKGAVGNYSQTPQPVGQVIMPGWGNPKMPSTKAAHYVLGYEWQITDLIHADVQAYVNNQWDIPRMADTNDLRRDLEGAQSVWLGDSKGRMRGLELMLRHDQGERFFGWLAYTLSRSERYDPSGKKWIIYDEDEMHHLQLIGSWRLPKQWESGFRLRYVSGKPTTPVDSVDDHETWKTYIPDWGEKNSERLDPFFQVDLRVDKKFVFDKWILTTYLDLQNISWFLYKSPEFEMYDDFYDDKTKVSNIFMPGIGIKAEF